VQLRDVSLLKDQYTLIEHSNRSTEATKMSIIMGIIQEQKKNYGRNFWEVLEGIICKILSIIDSSLVALNMEIHPSRGYTQCYHHTVILVH